jgi:Fe-S oxidoreductase
VAASAALLEQLGCDWTMLSVERDPGIDLWELGYTAEARAAAARFAADVAAWQPRSIVTGSSRVLRALHEMLPAWGSGPLPPARHISEYLLAEMGLSWHPRTPSTPETVAYHDPCALGRRLGVLDAPRQLVAAVAGRPPVELFHHGREAECCGGGGLLPEIDAALSGRLAEARLEGLPEGVATVVTACPTCRATLGGAAHTTGRGVRVLEIAEYVAARLGLATGA